MQQTVDPSSVVQQVICMGVAVPVFVFALLIVLAANKVGRVFKNVQRAERWARFGTGTIFMLIGFYFTLVYTLGLL